MAVRNTPKLTEILKKFQEAQRKTATELAATPEGIVSQAPASADDTVQDSAVLASAADSVPPVSTAGDAAAAQEVKAASEQVVDAKEALKAVTDDFINEHTAALKKEAQVFGELFAASCIDRMNKTAALQQAEQDAYLTTLETFGSWHDETELMNKTAAIYDEAYFTTLAKYAGLESVEELQAALAETPEALPPEVINAALAASGIDPMTVKNIDGKEDEEELDEAEDSEEGSGEEDESDEEEEAPRATVADALAEAANAASSNAAAIKSIAEAADALAAEGEYAEDDEAYEDAVDGVDGEALGAAEALGLPAEAPIAGSYVDDEGNIDLPKIASQAYDNVIAYLANGVR